MTKNILRNLFLAMGLLFLSGMQVQGKKIKIQSGKPTAVSVIPEKNPDSNDETFFDQGALVVVKDSTPDAQALFELPQSNLSRSHFTCGAEFGSSIDLTGNNLSTFDLDINLGFKNSFIKLAGVGVGFHRGLSSGDTYIPVYGVLRTSFRRKPSLFFMNIQAGYSFNTVAGSKYHGDLSTALGVGLNLTQSRRVKSFIILSAGSRYFNKNHKEIVNLDASYVTTAKMVIGVNF